MSTARRLQQIVAVTARVLNDGCNLFTNASAVRRVGLNSASLHHSPPSSRPSSLGGQSDRQLVGGSV
jgi:hypothetical protein